jgi:hypothetical protein
LVVEVRRGFAVVFLLVRLSYGRGRVSPFIDFGIGRENTINCWSHTIIIYIYIIAFEGSR